jgi:hypothetical protein
MFTTRSDMLDTFVKMLDDRIALDEEARDPDGALAGLYIAWKMAQDTLKEQYAPKPGLTAVVWADSQIDPVLSGEYEGREGVMEGISTVFMAVMDLLSAGKPGVQVEFYQRESE